MIFVQNLLKKDPKRASMLMLTQNIARKSDDCLEKNWIFFEKGRKG